jgi:hypothetical protein
MSKRRRSTHSEIVRQARVEALLMGLFALLMVGGVAGIWLYFTAVAG